MDSFSRIPRPGGPPPHRAPARFPKTRAGGRRTGGRRPGGRFGRADPVDPSAAVLRLVGRAPQPGRGGAPPRPPRLFGRGRRRGAGATAGAGAPDEPGDGSPLRRGAPALRPRSRPGLGGRGPPGGGPGGRGASHPAARRAVRKLLRPGETLPAVSYWADAYRARPEGAHTNVWHIAFFPAGAAAFIEARDCPRRGCAVRAIREQRAALADPRQSREERRRALMLLVHLVADIHQPLHAGRREDGGGEESPSAFSQNPSTCTRSGTAPSSGGPG